MASAQALLVDQPHVQGQEVAGARALYIDRPGQRVSPRRQADPLGIERGATLIDTRVGVLGLHAQEVPWSSPADRSHISRDVVAAAAGQVHQAAVWAALGGRLTNATRQGPHHRVHPLHDRRPGWPAAP